jgi:hypothetical protein
MDDDWWPKLLEHIAAESPWEASDVTVAEIKSFDDPGGRGYRHTFSALVPVTDLEEVEAHLGSLSYRVETSGPNPVPESAGHYTPKMWIGAVEPVKQRFEPLVAAWSSHDTTTLAVDPGFLMTYGLAPRAAESEVRHDNPSAPDFDVVCVRSPSIYLNGKHSSANVTISRDYIQDYLTLRGMALVHVYYEQRHGTDDVLISTLGDEKELYFNLQDRQFQISRGAGRNCIAQVWGARMVARPAGLPITADPLDTTGLPWPGVDGLTTHGTAGAMKPFDYVYVNDRVLEAYEGKPGFDLHPESGSVSFGHQWSVDFCSRVGRNFIKLELKKLYEGAPDRVIKHWHSHAAPFDAGAFGANTRNIAVRAGELVFSQIALGEALASLANRLTGSALRGVDFTKLDRTDLDVRGWWSAATTAPIGQHVPVDLPLDRFFNRVLALNSLLVEGLGEAKLRKLARSLGAPPDRTDEFRGLKLLDLIVRMSSLSHQTGIPISDGTGVLLERLDAIAEPEQPLTCLFALHDLRILGSHGGRPTPAQTSEVLLRFGIAAGAGAGGYGLALDVVYDRLKEEISRASQAIAFAE